MEKEQLEKLTREYQMIQENLQSLAIQKEQFKAQKEEFKEALDEIEKAKGKLYLTVGGIMVDVDKETATKHIKERQESNVMRLNIVDRQFEELSKKEQSLRNEITVALKDFKND